MIYIKTENAVKVLRELQLELSPKELATAQSRAINHTLLTIRTSARKQVKLVYNIAQKNLSGIDIKRSSPSTLTGKLVASRKPIPLDAFPVKQETGTQSISVSRKGVQKVRVFKRSRKNPTAGVTVEVKRGDKETIPFAFMIVGGAVRVFARGEYKSGTQHGFVLRHHRISNTGNDIPVKPLITLSMFGTVLNDKVISTISKDARQDARDRLVHEIQYIIRDR